MYKFSLLCFLFIMVGCSDNMPEQEPCGESIIVDADEYNDLTDQGLVFTNPQIDGDCLTVMVGFSGCDDTPEFDLITDGSIAESLPVQMFFKGRSDKNQACLAFFTKEVQYDLAPVRDLLNSIDKAILVFPGIDSRITWEL